MLRLLLWISLSAVGAASASGQTQQVLFPGQTGEELLASIRDGYRSTQFLSESASKDRLMDPVERTESGTPDTCDGSEGVIGVYTGLFVPFDCSPSADSNQDIFNNNNGLNVEHTWPKSRGSSRAPALVDLHHLLPTKVDVNSDRASLAFGEIPDNQTTGWYRGTESQATTPTDDIDAWSEIRSSSLFEPREDSKGNVARAMYYFWTMYGPNSQPGGGDGPADADWFAPQQRPLYLWSYQDPVDQVEYDRTFRAAQFQQDKPNPFVLDSTLIRRAFFPDLVTADDDGPEALAALVVAGANPFTAEARLTLTLPAPGAVRAQAFDALGRRVAVLYDGTAPAGPTALRLDGAGLASGVYLVRVQAPGLVLTRRLVRAR